MVVAAGAGSALLVELVRVRQEHDPRDLLHEEEVVAVVVDGVVPAVRVVRRDVDDSLPARFVGSQLLARGGEEMHGGGDLLLLPGGEVGQRSEHAVETGDGAVEGSLLGEQRLADGRGVAQDVVHLIVLV